MYPDAPPAEVIMKAAAGICDARFDMGGNEIHKCRGKCTIVCLAPPGSEWKRWYPWNVRSRRWVSVCEVAMNMYFTYYKNWKGPILPMGVTIWDQEEV